MKKLIYRDERWPIFYLEDPYEGMPTHMHSVEVPEALIEKYVAANVLYSEVMDELERIYNAK
jgi:hypothetical protein